MDAELGPRPARRAGVLGSPVAHSRSPQLHLAAYQALGLTDWRYDRIECDAAQLPRLVSDFGPEWVGVSVTMPGKFAALAVADERTERAALAGSANTLLRTDSGWRADNTDVDGVAGALADQLRTRAEPVGTAVVLGSGGTAPAAVIALAELGAEQIVIAARNADRAAELVALAAAVDCSARHCELDTAKLADIVGTAGVVVSTLPAPVAAELADAVSAAPVLLDAIYDPWPTPLASAVSKAGGVVIGGLQMLLHQAFAQVEQFTGLPAPREAMAAALDKVVNSP